MRRGQLQDMHNKQMYVVQSPMPIGWETIGLNVSPHIPQKALLTEESVLRLRAEVPGIKIILVPEENSVPSEEIQSLPEESKVEIPEVATLMDQYVLGENSELRSSGLDWNISLEYIKSLRNSQRQLEIFLDGETRVRPIREFNKRFGIEVVDDEE